MESAVACTAEEFAGGWVVAEVAVLGEPSEVLGDRVAAIVILGACEAPSPNPDGKLVQQMLRQEARS
jgi:hypothetical protein